MTKYPDHVPVDYVVTDPTAPGYNVPHTELHDSLTDALVALTAAVANPATAPVESPDLSGAIAGNGQVTIPFTLPADATGIVIKRDGGAAYTGATSPFVDSGLTNGTAHSYTANFYAGTASNMGPSSVAATRTPAAPLTADIVQSASNSIYTGSGGVSSTVTVTLANPPSPGNLLFAVFSNSQPYTATMATGPNWVQNGQSAPSAFSGLPFGMILGTSQHVVASSGESTSYAFTATRTDTGAAPADSWAVVILLELKGVSYGAPQIVWDAASNALTSPNATPTEAGCLALAVFGELWGGVTGTGHTSAAAAPTSHSSGWTGVTTVVPDYYAMHVSRKTALTTDTVTAQHDTINNFHTAAANINATVLFHPAGNTNTPPGKTTGVTLGTASANSQPVSWTATPAATSYLIEYKKHTDSTWSVGFTTTDSSYTVTGLTASTSYDYLVIPKNVAGQGTASDSVTGSTPAVGGGARLLGGTYDLTNHTAYPINFTAPAPIAIPAGATAIALGTGASIQTALNAGTTGQAFVLASGTYTGTGVSAPLTPKAGQSIYGRGAGVTILDNCPIWAADTSRNGVTIANITFRNFQPAGNTTSSYPNNVGAVDSNFDADKAQAWHVYNCEFHDNWIGCITSSGGEIVNCIAYDNLHNGLAGGANGGLIQYCASYRNGKYAPGDGGDHKAGLLGNSYNVGQASPPGWPKFSEGGTRPRFLNNYFSDSGYDGFWSDVNGQGALWQDNICVRCDQAGIHDEINLAGDIIRHNICAGNGVRQLDWQGSGITLSTCIGVTVDNNYCWGNFAADIQIFNQSRNHTYGAHTITNNHVQKAIPNDGMSTYTGNTVSDPTTWTIPSIVCGPQV